jgi:hypothetical protein
MVGLLFLLIHNYSTTLNLCSISVKFAGVVRGVVRGPVRIVPVEIEDPLTSKMTSLIIITHPIHYVTCALFL